MRKILADHYVHRNQSELIKSTIRERGRHRIIDKVTVTLNERADVYEAEFADLGIKGVLIEPATIKAHPELLVGGVWCICDIEYFHSEDAGVVPWILGSIKPIQLRGLVKCGPCGVGASCHKMRGRNGTWHRYYYCHNHDPVRAGGHDRRCPERNIRADALDEFVFGQIRAALLDPAQLPAGEQAIAVHAPAPGDQLLAAELARLDRRLEAARGEHRRLIDLYQAGLIDMPELHRRATAITAPQRELEHKRISLAAQRADLARGNRLRRGVEHFAARVAAVIDQLNPAQRKELLRLLIEDVQVTGWHVKIRLRIPLDDSPDGDHPRRRTPSPRPAPASSGTAPMSTQDRLRSLHVHERAQLPAQPTPRACHPHREHERQLESEHGQDLGNYLIKGNISK